MRTACAALLLSLARPALAAEPPAYGPELEGFDYPHPVKRFAFESQGEKLQMAYMDIQPGTPNGRTLVLLHGKNFCGATWEGSIEALTQAGYRVVVPDQVGFCKSSKPQRYQFSFQQLAANTHALLATLKLEKVTLMGHSMGGMLATRYALQYPEQVEQLVMVNPIGLEDWKAKGVPWRSVDAWYQRELKTTSDAIRTYQKNTYYSGQWRPEFDKWVEMQAGLYRGKGREAVAWDSALTYDMIYTQPVVHEFDRLRMPVLLLIGQTDSTAPGKDTAPEALRSQLGNYKVLGQQAAERIPDARLVTFADLGHSPQIQAPEVFHKTLLEGLGNP
ncbi:alpha/beta fold hydrolase [Pseudomonas tohonis]|uniref:alpha/beta fold hydrolase n=1 Tax=Pseudomonas tohonis TaxID=2725477 RepID=UPI001F1D69B1|nr:alpha/beta hydrolase [Pseudomonas tohonis]